MDIENPGDITLNLWLNQGTEDLGEAVAEQWERNLGINVRTSVVEWSDYVETLGGCGGDRQ